MKTKHADGLSRIFRGSLRTTERPDRWHATRPAALVEGAPDLRGPPVISQTGIRLRQPERVFPLHVVRYAGLIAMLLMAMARMASAALVLEEGFNYPSGSGLANNSPWIGAAGASLGIVSGNLAVPGMPGTLPPGNMLQLSGGGGRAYRSFGVTAIPDGNLYCSLLINCSQFPTSSQFALALMATGVTQPNQPDDPLDLYFSWRTNGGYVLSVSHTGSDPASTRTLLQTNGTHLIVLRYTDGLGSRCRLYLDPPVGSAEPASPDAITEADDGGAAGTPVSQMGTLLLNPSGSGVFMIDTLRIGTQWADVAPGRTPLTVSGPLNTAICSGSSAAFSFSITGTPPFGYQWRTNGVAIAGATNSLLSLASPGPADALSYYDVVVTDAYGSITSGVATLTISHRPPGITSAPVSAVILPGTSNATFSVLAVGDPPLSYQWRTNGIAIPGATNDTFTVANPGAADAANAYDIVVANPCGSVASAPAQIVFPHEFLPCAALPGFFSGMNLFTTNAPGLALYVWSSLDPSLSITTWTLEGLLAEQPLNDGTGNSRYSINVNPVTSPVYYVIGQTNVGPYVSPVPVQVITTDSSGNSTLDTTNVSISSSGLLAWSVAPTLPSITLQQTGNGMQVNGLGLAGGIYLVQVTASLNPAVWVTMVTNVADANGGFQFTDSNAAIHPRRFYRLVAASGAPAGPVFIKQPKTQAVNVGNPANFGAWVAGVPPLSYQWYFMSTPLPNATSANLTLSSTSIKNAGAYTLVVANSFGSVTSSVATLSIVLPQQPTSPLGL